MKYAKLLALAGCVIGLLAGPNPCAAGEPSKTLNERLLVIHPASPAKMKETERLASQSAYDGIVELLTDKGYRLVDRSAAEKCSQELASTHDIDPSLNKAASFGLKFFAEYTVSYDLSVLTKDNDGGKGALVKLNAKIVDNTTAQIVTSKSSDASSAGVTVEDALDKAGRNAGRKLATSLAAALEKNYRDSVQAGRIYTVVIENPAGEDDLLKLLPGLEENKFVFAARETESGGGKMSFEITYRGKRDQLDRDLLVLASDLGWKMRKVRSEGNRSSWRLE